MKPTRREFFQRSAATGAILSAPYIFTSSSAAAEDSDNRPTVAAIGVGGSRGAYSQGRAIALRAAQHGRMVAVCDVDAVHMAEFNARFENKLALYTDYRQLLEREKPDIVTIGTPDHWHVPIAITALRAGCDVYCEKPLTLTIEEGFRIRDAVKQTGRVFQVGTQQRSEHGLLFLKAIAIVRSGRLGDNVRAHCAIGGSPEGGPFAATPPPAGLDWNMWVGPARTADYYPERCKEFRWYYDYSGGQMTDWGAHNIDIAQWGLGLSSTGPTKVSGAAKFPPVVPENFDWLAYFEGRANLPNAYHTATSFHMNLDYAGGQRITLHDHYQSDDGETQFPNGILFEGDEGRIYVNRERLTGKPVEELTEADNQRLHDDIVKIYNDRRPAEPRRTTDRSARGPYNVQEPGDHMRNFFECVASRETPISDVETHHRTMTACHLCNIALLLGRDVEWDPNEEKFIGDDQATALMTRPRREEFSWQATT